VLDNRSSRLYLRPSAPEALGLAGECSEFIQPLKTPANSKHARTPLRYWVGPRLSGDLNRNHKTN